MLIIILIILIILVVSLLFVHLCGNKTYSRYGGVFSYGNIPSEKDRKRFDEASNRFLDNFEKADMEKRPLPYVEPTPYATPTPPPSVSSSSQPSQTPHLPPPPPQYSNFSPLLRPPSVSQSLRRAPPPPPPSSTHIPLSFVVESHNPSAATATGEVSSEVSRLPQPPVFVAPFNEHIFWKRAVQIIINTFTEQGGRTPLTNARGPVYYSSVGLLEFLYFMAKNYSNGHVIDGFQYISAGANNVVFSILPRNIKFISHIGSDRRMFISDQAVVRVVYRINREKTANVFKERLSVLSVTKDPIVEYVMSNLYFVSDMNWLPQYKKESVTEKPNWIKSVANGAASMVSRTARGVGHTAAAVAKGVGSLFTRRARPAQSSSPVPPPSISMPEPPIVTMVNEDKAITEGLPDYYRGHEIVPSFWSINQKCKTFNGYSEIFRYKQSKELFSAYLKLKQQLHHIHRIGYYYYDMKINNIGFYMQKERSSGNNIVCRVIDPSFYYKEGNAFSSAGYRQVRVIAGSYSMVNSQYRGQTMSIYTEWCDLISCLIMTDVETDNWRHLKKDGDRNKTTADLSVKTKYDILRSFIQNKIDAGLSGILPAWSMANEDVYIRFIDGLLSYIEQPDNWPKFIKNLAAMKNIPERELSTKDSDLPIIDTDANYRKDRVVTAEMLVEYYKDQYNYTIIPPIVQDSNFTETAFNGLIDNFILSKQQKGDTGDDDEADGLIIAEITHGPEEAPMPSATYVRQSLPAPTFAHQTYAHGVREATRTDLAPTSRSPPPIPPASVPQTPPIPPASVPQTPQIPPASVPQTSLPPTNSKLTGSHIDLVSKLRSKLFNE